MGLGVPASARQRGRSKSSKVLHDAARDNPLVRSLQLQRRRSGEIAARCTDPGGASGPSPGLLQFRPARESDGSDSALPRSRSAGANAGLHHGGKAGGQARLDRALRRLVRGAVRSGDAADPASEGTGTARLQPQGASFGAWRHWAIAMSLGARGAGLLCGAQEWPGDISRQSYRGRPDALRGRDQAQRQGLDWRFDRLPQRLPKELFGTRTASRADHQ